MILQTVDAVKLVFDKFMHYSLGFRAKLTVTHLYIEDALVIESERGIKVMSFGRFRRLIEDDEFKELDELVFNVVDEMRKR